MQQGHAAAARYSWMSPPSTSRRCTCRDWVRIESWSRPSGTASARPRCGRWRLQGRPGARCPPLDEPVSPDRPPNPACQSSRHRALHEARHQQRLRCRSAPQYPTWTARSDAGIHRRLLPCRPATAAPLCPFALCTPLACSDYYGHSATTRHHQPTTRLPAARRQGGRRRVASHVHHHPVDEVGSGSGSASLRPRPLRTGLARFPGISAQASLAGS